MYRERSEGASSRSVFNLVVAFRAVGGHLGVNAAFGQLVQAHAFLRSPE
jgi:hypothetical protein